MKAGKAGVSDAETLAAEPGQSVAEPADRVMHPGTFDSTPIRACCGQRHHGPVCPDGLVMCCICFNRVPKERLAVVEEGDGSSVDSAPVYEDVCMTCRRREEQWGRAHE